MKLESVTSSPVICSLMSRRALHVITTLFLMTSSDAFNLSPLLQTLPFRPSPMHQTSLQATLRDLLNDDDHPKKKKPEENNFFSKIVDSAPRQRGFPSRNKTSLTEEEEERGQHVDRLGAFSFSVEGGKRLIDIVSEEEESDILADSEGDGAPDDENASTDSVSKGSSTDNIMSELLPDNYNNRGVFISKHKFPKEPQTRSVAGGASNSPKDDHAGALRTFSFASPPKATVASSDEAPKPGVGRESYASTKSKAANRKMDRLGTFSLGRNTVPEYIGPSQPSKSGNVDNGGDNHGDRMSTFSNSRNANLEYIGPAQPSKSGAASDGGGDNHGDRMSTFSFASTVPKSGSTTAKSQDAFSSQGIQDTSTDTVEHSSIDSDQLPLTPPPPPQATTSLSGLASSVATTTRNDRISEIKARNDPRTLHPDGMNVPRLNKGGFVMSMSGREGKKNIFQRIDDELGNTEEERAAINAAANAESNGANEDVAAAVGGYTAGSAAASTTDWGDLSEAMDVGKKSKSKYDDSDDQDPNESADCFIGFDLGTSGARISIVEQRSVEENSSTHWDYVEVFAAALSWDDILHYDDAYDWRSAVDALLMRAKEDVPDVMARVKAMCVSGTSATCLLLEKGTLDVSRVVRMYNFDILANSEKKGFSKSGKASPGDRVKELIGKYVPEKHTARATTGSLAKLLLWNEESSLVDEDGNVKEMLCHQSDYISLSLMFGGVEKDLECTVSSDWHNCLKLGYDVKSLSYPTWMLDLLKEGANIPTPNDVLPSKVVSPGEPIGIISPIVASKYGLPADAVMVGGTTDSNAAFFAAAGVKAEFGLAVTSLGSTVALKQLSKTYVEDASKGVYSHRFPRFGDSDGEEEAWLIGGASNVGCAVLRQEEFSNEELTELSSEIDPNTDSPLSYYPLTKKGERFPVADSEKTPILDPKPNDRKEYLHGLLQAIGDVERDGYRTLGELGATPNRPTEILTCGGGSKNDVWTVMRERRLKDICNSEQRIVVKRAMNTEASYGASLLAAASFE